MNAPASMLISPEPPMCEATSNDLSVVAAQLVEAARRARDGDREAARAHIAHAVALLHGKPSSGPSVTRALSIVQRQLARGGLTAWQARRLVAHVDANFARRIRVAELAELIDLGTSHFSRAFKRAFGVSPHTYVLRRRIEVAQVLMLTTREPLSSIALTCGMCDQSHLTHSFHRIVGETPGTWRRTRPSALEDRRIGLPRPPPDATYLLVQRTLSLRAALDEARRTIAALQSAQRQESASDPLRACGSPPEAIPAAQALERRRLDVAAPPAGPSYATRAVSSVSAGDGALPSVLGQAAARAAGVASGAFLFQGVEDLLGHHGSTLSAHDTAPPAGDVTVNNYHGSEPADEREAALDRDSGTDDFAHTDDDLSEPARTPISGTPSRSFR